MAAPLKLTDADLKQIRRRVRRGEHQADLAVEFGVNRKTIRRRLNALENAERREAERLAQTRLRRQAAREKRKLLGHEQVVARPADDAQHPDHPRAPMRVRNPYYDWLDTAKNLSRRALAEENGLVRLARGGDRRWVDRSEVDAYFDDGWVLEDRVRH